MPPVALDDIYLSKIRPASMSDVTLASLQKDVTAPEDVEKLKALSPYAKYKTELRLDGRRNSKGAVCRIDLWESGQTEGGGGDYKLFLCGYSDCGKPIPPSHIGRILDPAIIQQTPAHNRWRLLEGHFAICPSCMEKGRNNYGRQLSSPESAGIRLSEKGKLTQMMNRVKVRDPQSGIDYPCVRDCMFVAGPTRVIVDLLIRYWRYFEDKGLCDFYFKYNPFSIREDQQRNVETSGYDERETVAIYLGKTLVRDLMNGSSLYSRLMAFLR